MVTDIFKLVIYADDTTLLSQFNLYVYTTKMVKNIEIHS
jgi:hypothetical protein